MSDYQELPIATHLVTVSTTWRGRGRVLQEGILRRGIYLRLTELMCIIGEDGSVVSQEMSIGGARFFLRLMNRQNHGNFSPRLGSGSKRKDKDLINFDPDAVAKAEQLLAGAKEIYPVARRGLRLPAGIDC